MWTKKINPTTNLPELVGQATLVSLSEEIKTNSNGKGYVLGTAKVNLNGKESTISCSVYEKNLTHGVEVGNKYLATLSKGTDGKVYCQVSHLVATDDISEDFDNLFSALEVESTATTASAEIL